MRAQLAGKIAHLSEITQAAFVDPLKDLPRVGTLIKDRGYRQVWLMAVAIQTSLVVYLVGSFFASVAYLWYVYYPAAFAVCLQQILRQAERLPAQNGVEPRVWYLRRVQH